jgi:hypothetical protein
MNLEQYKTNLFNKETKITNRRQEVVKEFVDAINLERQGTKYKPVTGKQIAIRLGGLPTRELELFLAECNDYRNRNGSFGKRFYGGFKEHDYE